MCACVASTRFIKESVYAIRLFCAIAIYSCFTFDVCSLFFLPRLVGICARIMITLCLRCTLHCSCVTLVLAMSGYFLSVVILILPFLSLSIASHQLAIPNSGHSYCCCFHNQSTLNLSNLSAASCHEFALHWLLPVDGLTAFHHPPGQTRGLITSRMHTIVSFDPAPTLKIMLILCSMNVLVPIVINKPAVLMLLTMDSTICALMGKQFFAPVSLGGYCMYTE